jgi:hypothetical protein
VLSTVQAKPASAVATSSNLSVVEQSTKVQKPVEAQTNIDLPIVVEPTEAQTIVPIEAQTNIDLPIVVEPTEAQTIVPIEAQTNIDLPIVVEPTEPQTIVSIEAKNNNQIWCRSYGKEFQGLVITDQKIESHYCDIHTALLRTILNCSHAILILEGYMMALIKQMDSFYMFDSHARDSSGMPYPDGTAVVMKFTNIQELEQHLYSLSIELHANLFEIVPVLLVGTEKALLHKTSESKK